MPLSVPSGGTGGAWVLPSTLPGGARTFLRARNICCWRGGHPVYRAPTKRHSSISPYEGQGKYEVAEPLPAGYANLDMLDGEAGYVEGVSLRGDLYSLGSPPGMNPLAAWAKE